MKLLERAASDWTFLRGLVRTISRTSKVAKNRTFTIRDFIEELAAKFADRPALVSDTESLTYRQLNGRANRYADWARQQGIGKGDVVALCMPNRPEYIAAWMGIAKIGGVTALLNTNLSGASLAHSINIVKARWAIVDLTLLARFETAQDGFEHPVDVFVHGGEAPGAIRLDTLLDNCSPADQPQAERVPLTINDGCLYVYTSGTTGLPKAANVNQYRTQLVMRGFAAIANTTAADRVYDALPMYHTNGGLIGPGMALVAGGTCVLREKFSARDFFTDIARTECTIFVYIGELCRYVLDTPPTDADRAHHVRLCVGNGLRPDVWRPFRDRFALKKIIEFYSATEGNCSMFNLDSRPDAVGRVPSWIASRFPISIVDYDVEAEQVVRGPDGLCRATPGGGVGELIGEIVDDPSKPGNRFEGYSDQKATQAKILRNVFKQGDSWFRTGDLMRKDKEGYHYFVDRIGDTFRWKGENVSTAEVSQVIGAYPGVKDACVYGVHVKGRDGRAGMASVVVDDPHSFDMAALAAYLGERLPAYAMPVFLRFPHHLTLTATFKQRKTDLVQDGFDPARCGDPLYLKDQAGPYRPLDVAVYDQVMAGHVRL